VKQKGTPKIREQLDKLDPTDKKDLELLFALYAEGAISRRAAAKRILRAFDEKPNTSVLEKQLGKLRGAYGRLFSCTRVVCASCPRNGNDSCARAYGIRGMTP